MSLTDIANKEYRDAYVSAHVRAVIALQIRNLREKHNWSQGQLAERARTSQSAIARIEDPDYGRVNVGTLLKLAAVFDVALVAKFVSHSKFMLEYADLSPRGLRAASFSRIQPTAPLTASSPENVTRVFVSTQAASDESTRLDAPPLSLASGPDAVAGKLIVRTNNFLSETARF